MRTLELNFSNFVIKYFKFETESENILPWLSGAQMGSNHGKNRYLKSFDTLRQTLMCNYGLNSIPTKYVSHGDFSVQHNVSGRILCAFYGRNLSPLMQVMENFLFSIIKYLVLLAKIQQLFFSICVLLLEIKLFKVTSTTNRPSIQRAIF